MLAQNFGSNNSTTLFFIFRDKFNNTTVKNFIIFCKVDKNLVKIDENLVKNVNKTAERRLRFTKL